MRTTIDKMEATFISTEFYIELPHGPTRVEIKSIETSRYNKNATTDYYNNRKKA